MIPVVTPSEMAEVDRLAREPVEVLIERAGAAVARAGLGMLGGGYGRRVVVLAGKGSNGADGRAAGRLLAARGAKVVVLDALRPPRRLPAADLVIDAALGTGFRGTYSAPEPAGSAPVLAVDVPSGVDGRTGEVGGRVLAATRTVTFAALKPGLVFEPGAGLAGEVEVADIGLGVRSTVNLVELDDVRRWLPERAPDAHKWLSAVWIVAGSPGMSGAAALCSGGAQRAGAGYVRLSSVGAWCDDAPVEVVQVPLPEVGWGSTVSEGLGRFGALVVGNGVGTQPEVVGEVRSLVGAALVPTVVDADAITALGRSAASVLAARSDPSQVVLTPHDGEFARLTGEAPGPDRIGSARRLAGDLGAVVLLKGPTTVVAHPDGRVLLSTSGRPSLATAGTGDVLAGILGALCARGAEPWMAAAAAAHLHGLAADLGWRSGLVASDLLRTLPIVLDAITDTEWSGRTDPDGS